MQAKQAKQAEQAEQAEQERYSLLDLPNDILRQIFAKLDRKSLVNLAESKTSWAKPLTAPGCGFDDPIPPDKCNKNVNYDDETINHALLCAVHNSNALSLPVVPGRTAEPYLHLTVSSDQVTHANANGPLRCFVDSGFPLEVTLTYRSQDLLTMEHTNSVESVCVTPDGAHVITASMDSASADSNAHVWDLQNGTYLRTLMGHNQSVKSVCVTPDGKRAVTGSYEGVACVWILENGALERALKTNSGPIHHVCATDTVVVTGSIDDYRMVNSARVWKLHTGESYITLNFVDSLCLTPDGAHVVTIGYEMGQNRLIVTNLQDGNRLRSFNVNSHSRTICVTPDGTLAVSMWFNRVNVYDLQNGALLRGFAVGRLNTNMCVTPDGNHLVTASSMWNLHTGACLCTIEDLDDQNDRRGDGFNYMAGVCLTPGTNPMVISAKSYKLRAWPIVKVAGVTPSVLRVLPMPGRSKYNPIDLSTVPGRSKDNPIDLS
tara:strand:- start:768 stop:2234 length:1467 start_codon:yes stop_codon:yes gene_type:complete